MKIFKTKKGFTLIELLIVIAIIGILFAALIGSFSAAPSKARDGARKLDLANISTAIEEFNLSYGQYPQVPLGGCAKDIFKDPVVPADDVAYKFFSGGNVPADPSGVRKVANDLGTCLGVDGGYYYEFLGDPLVGQYMLAASMEEVDSNNSESTAAPYSTDPAACLADCDVFIIIK